MTCTTSCSSSMKKLGRILTSFLLKERISFMGKSTSSKIPFRHHIPSKKGTWSTSSQPSKSTSQPILRLLKKSCWGHPAPQKKLLPTNPSSKNYVTSFPSHTMKCLDWTHPLWNTIYTHGPMWPPCAKINGPSIPPKLSWSKMKLRSYE